MQGSLALKVTRMNFAEWSGLFQERMEVGSEQREPKGMLGGLLISGHRGYKGQVVGTLFVRP